MSFEVNHAKPLENRTNTHTQSRIRAKDSERVFVFSSTLMVEFRTDV